MAPSRHFGQQTCSLIAAALVLVGVGCAPAHPAGTDALPDGTRGGLATVTSVVDGDTVDLALAGQGTERARLLGIDTPETVKPDHPVECFGPEASAQTKHLLAPGTEVLIKRDAQARDRYGRLLVYVWRRTDGLFVNRELVIGGYARTLSIAPNTAHRADLAEASNDARSSGRGLWGSCPSSP